MVELKFNPKATKLDQVNAKQLAQISKQAYLSEQEFKSAVSQIWDFDHFHYFEFINNQVFIDSQAYLVADQNVIILVFRGTEPKDIRDWVTDFKYKLIKSKTGRVHHGFVFALNPIWHGIKNAINEIRTSNQSLWVTGHSLGGALATIAADRFTDQGTIVNGIYTFGQPRVGDKEFAEHFDQKTKNIMFRFVNNEDFVTTIPGAWLLLKHARDYQHVGNSVYFDTFENIHINPNSWFVFLDRALSKALRIIAWLRKQKSRWRHDFEDHDMKKYVSLVETQKSKV